MAVRLVGRCDRSDLGEGSLDRIVEVVAVERCEQPVVVHEVLQPVAQLDECDVDALLVQLDVELFEHVGRGDVDVGDRLALQDDPPWVALAHEFAHLLAEHAGVGEEQRRFPPVHEDAGQFLDDGVVVTRCASHPRRRSRPSTSPCGHQLRLKNSRIDSTTAMRMPSSTPKKTTPPVATSERTNELRRTFR